jgi:hypothetical protein
MARDSSDSRHIAFVRVCCCAAIYDDALVDIAIFCSSGEGECEDESEKPGLWRRELRDDEGVNFMGTILSKVVSRCKKRYLFVWLVERVCLGCGEVMFSRGEEGSDFINVCMIHNSVFLRSPYIIEWKSCNRTIRTGNLFFESGLFAQDKFNLIYTVFDLLCAANESQQIIIVKI